MVVKQFDETIHVGIARGFLGTHTSLNGIMQFFLQFVANALLGGFAVQRVVYAHPCYGDVSATAELAVAEHLRREVAHLDVEGSQLHSRGDGLQHESENLLPFAFVEGVAVFSLAEDAAVPVDERRNPCAPCPDHCKQASRKASFLVPGNNHIRRMSRCMLIDDEQLPAVENIP